MILPRNPHVFQAAYYSDGGREGWVIFTPIPAKTGSAWMWIPQTWMVAS